MPAPRRPRGRRRERRTQLTFATKKPSKGEGRDVAHGEQRAGGCHALRFTRDAGAVRDVDLADGTAARAEGDEHFGLEKVRLASGRNGPELLGPVELHAVYVVHRQPEDPAQQARVELSDDDAARRVASRDAATDDQRGAIAYRPHRLERGGGYLAVRGREVDPLTMRFGVQTLHRRRDPQTGRIAQQPKLSDLGA